MLRTATIFLALSSTATAAINVEEIRLSPDEEGLNGEAELGGSLKTGNLEFASLTTGAGVGYRAGDHMAFLIGSYTYAAKRSGGDLDAEGSLLSEEFRYSNKGSAHLRYNYNLSDSLALELFSQVEFNEFLRLDLRTLGGTGVRTRLVDNDMLTAYAGVGYMLERESYSESVVVEEDLIATSHRLNTYLSLSADPAESTSTTLTAYFQENIAKLCDYRVMIDAELEHRLTQRIALNLSFSARFDSEPPNVIEGATEIRPLDTVTATSFSYEF